MLNTSYLFTHSSSSSFFLFTQTGTTRSIRCETPITYLLIFLPSFCSPRQVPPGQLGVKHQLPIYSFFFLLFVHPDRYHQVNSVLNTSYLFTHSSSSSFFLFTQTGTTRSIRCETPITYLLILLPSFCSLRQVPPGQFGAKHQLPICSFLFFFLRFLHPDRNHPVDQRLNTNYLFTHSSSSSFFLFTQTGTIRSIRC